MALSFTDQLLRRFTRLVQPGVGQRSMRQVAKQVGVDHSAIVRWMNGTRTPSGRSIDRILRWVEVEERRERHTM